MTGQTSDDGEPFASRHQTQKRQQQGLPIKKEKSDKELKEIERTKLERSYVVRCIDVGLTVWLEELMTK